MVGGMLQLLIKMDKGTYIIISLKYLNGFSEMKNI